MIDAKSMGAEVRTKNIIHGKPMINRGPKEVAEEDDNDSNLAGSLKSLTKGNVVG